MSAGALDMDILSNTFDTNLVDATKVNTNTTVDQFVEEIKQKTQENREEVKDEVNLLHSCDIYRQMKIETVKEELDNMTEMSVKEK